MRSGCRPLRPRITCPQRQQKTAPSSTRGSEKKRPLPSAWRRTTGTRAYAPMSSLWPSFSTAREIRSSQRGQVSWLMVRIAPGGQTFSSAALNGFLARLTKYSNGCCAGFTPASLFTRAATAPGHPVCVYAVLMHPLYSTPRPASTPMSRARALFLPRGGATRRCRLRPTAAHRRSRPCARAGAGSPARIRAGAGRAA